MVDLDIFSASWFLAFGVVLFVALVRGTTGFGFALILAPILLLLLEPTSVVVVTLLLGLLANIVVVAASPRDIRWRWITPMLAGLASDFFASSTSVGGPPVVLFMHSQNLGKESIHRNLAVCPLLTTSGSLIGLLIAGLVRGPTMLTAPAPAPAWSPFAASTSECSAGCRWPSWSAPASWPFSPGWASSVRRGLATGGKGG